LLHLVAAELRDDVLAEDVQRALAYAHALAAGEGVRAVCYGRSETHLLAAVWLDDVKALEPFAASEEHMTFIMRGLATVIRSMWSASVATEGPPPTESFAALWLFAVPEFEGVFEWEVRKFLEDIEMLPGTCWAGPTVEERERYRAGGAVLLTATEINSFQDSLATATTGWGSLANRLQQAVTPTVVINRARS
jgi:hypothetical protein